MNELSTDTVYNMSQSQGDSCGKRKKPTAPSNSLLSMSVDDMRKKLKGAKKLSTLKRRQLCDLLIQMGYKPKTPSPSSKLAMGYIKYDGSNSCYVDTMLTALLHRPNVKWVVTNILKKVPPHANHPKLQAIALEIQSAIVLLYKTIHKGNTIANCSRLRSLFRDFDKEYSATHSFKIPHIEWTHSQQEPTDVANILMRIFGIKEDVKMKMTSKTTKRTELRYFNSPLIDIGELKMHRKIYMKSYVPIFTDSFINEKDGKPYTKVTRVVKASLLQVNVSRNFLNEEKVTTPVIPEEEFKVCSAASVEDCKKILKCVSILIHHGSSPKGGHYTCMIKSHKDDKWYHYDDMNSKYVLIGGFDTMLRWRKGYVTRNLVSCVYL